MSVTVMTIKPGRWEDFIAGQKEAEAVLTKCGAKNLRLIAAMAAGEASGSVVATFEADDFADYGKVTQAFFDGDGIKIMEGLGNPDSPIATWHTSMYLDVPR